MKRSYKAEIHTVGELSFTLEPSWLRSKLWDILFWETNGSTQHNFIIGVTMPFDQALEYATSLATSVPHHLLTQIRYKRDRALRKAEDLGV